MTRSLRASRTGRALVRWCKRGRQAWARRRWGFDRAAFVATLGRVGVARGDVLLVHSSYDRFTGFTGTVRDVIGALQESVGREGTIVMPTTPFTGTAVDWVAGGRIFDAARTPSQMGLVTELFRRSPGVIRSVHPTHPVAAWGAHAEALTRDHHRAATPCGAGSPYLRLLDYDGKILLLGTGVTAFTFYHGVEELLEPELPFSPFTAEVFHLTSRDRDGTILPTTTRLFDPGWSRRRDMTTLVPVLTRRGDWRAATVGRLDVVLLRCRDVVDACRALAKDGMYCYDTASPAPE